MNSSFLQTVQLGLKSLLLQKMRAGLAALGIFIGTTTVIWLVAMGEGVNYLAQQQIKELGATNIIIRSKQPTSGSDGQDANSRIRTYGLLRADYRRIVENISSIRRTVPMREVRFELRLGNRTADAVLVGVLFGLLCGPIFRSLRGGVTLMSPDLLPPIVYTLEPRIAPWSVALSLFISIGVGLLFGVYPARQAAFMDPIEALRHE